MEKLSWEKLVLSIILGLSNFLLSYEKHRENRFGLAPTHERPGDGPSHCGLSITADVRPKAGEREKNAFCRLHQKACFFLSPVLDGPQHEGPSRSFTCWSQLKPMENLPFPCSA